MRRTRLQKFIDLVTFPLRALTLFHENGWGMSSLATERFDYVAREVRGRCLDIGCGRHDRFITEFCDGKGKGIDVYPYEGLTEENIVADLTHFPFPDNSFGTVTFIANINHIPESKRDVELHEAYRCLKPAGCIVVTMGHPLAEILVHKIVFLYDKLFKTNLDVDSERGMDDGEAYYLTDAEITTRLAKAGFCGIRKKLFATQWGLNHLFVGWKR